MYAGTDRCEFPLQVGNITEEELCMFDKSSHIVVLID
jgi:hypothetical protein